MKGEEQKGMKDMASKTIEATEVRTQEAHKIFFDIIDNPAEVNDYTRSFFEEYIKGKYNVEGKHDKKRTE